MYLNIKERLKYLSKTCIKNSFYEFYERGKLIMLLSSKVTHSILRFLESNGLDSESLYSAINTPEEFLKDPSSWQPAKNIEFFLAKSESLFKETVAQKSDRSFIQCVGHECAKLKSWGVLDGVLKMIKQPKQFYVEPINFLSYFISPTPSVNQLQITTSDQTSFNLNFHLDFNTNNYPHFVSYFIAVLEALPTYLNYNLADVSWKGHHVNISWRDHQTSFFSEDKKILDKSPKNLNHPLESLEKDKELLTKKEGFAQKNQYAPKQLHLSQSDSRSGNQKGDLEQLDTWEKLTHQLVSEINPYILKSINNTQKLKDYFIRARQILTILVGQEKYRSSYIKDSMKRMNWNFVTQEFSSAVEESMQDLLTIGETLESLLITEPQKTKVDLSLLLTTVVNDIIGQESHIKVDYHFVRVKKIMVFHQHLKHALMHLIRAIVPYLNDKGAIKLSTHLKNKTVEIRIFSRGLDNYYQKDRNIHLTIAHWLIRMHNGKISIQDYFNKEITFLVHLPIGV